MLDRLTTDEIREAEQIQFDIFMGETTEAEAKERYKITNIDSANWALRKLKAIKEKEEEINQLTEREIDRIKKWAATETSALAVNAQFFEGLLTEYFVTEREKDPKFKISTPYGKVSARKQQPKWHYEDEKLLPYIENYNPDLIRVKKEINKTEFKKAVNEGNGFVLIDDGKIAHSETGEILEGITVTEQPDSVSIKVVE